MVCEHKIGVYPIKNKKINTKEMQLTHSDVGTRMLRIVDLQRIYSWFAHFSVSG